MTRQKASKSRIPAKRFLGLELAGAKNPKTTLSVLEHYAREDKIFLLETHEGIGSTGAQTADEFLIELLNQSAPKGTLIGTSSALTLPPSFLPTREQLPAMRWMKEERKRIERKWGQAKEFTPYTQRPIELYLRYEVMPSLKRPLTFEIDEALGGSRAPLTARMNHLLRYVKGVRWIEALPKLTLARLAPHLRGVTLRSLQGYRHLEHGAYARQEILDALCESFNLFIYDGDMKKLSRNLNAFDSLLCGLTAILSEQGKTVEPPRGFPEASGWVYFPK